MGDFDQILECSISSPGFNLLDCSIQQDSVTDTSNGPPVRIGTKYTVICTGEVLGDDAASYAGNVSDFRKALLEAERQDFWIKSFGVYQFNLPTAMCVNGGPSITTALEDNQRAEAALVRPVKFTMVAQTAESDKDDKKNQPQSLEISTDTRVDGNRTITYSGKFIDPAGDATSYFDTWSDNLIAQTYPGTKFVESHEVDSTFSDQQISFKLSFKELANPIAIVSQNYTIVDGELEQKNVSRDEQMRKVTTWTFTATLTDGSDTDAFQTDVRAIVQKAIKTNMILRETFEATRTQQVTGKGTFVVLEGGDGSDLLDWEQSFEEDNPLGENRVPIVSFDFPGRLPLLVRAPQKVYTYTQSGRAVGVNRFPSPAPPVFNVRNLEWEGVRRLTRKNIVECETTWSYKFVFINPAILPSKSVLDRPDAATIKWLQ